jgi:hypothetical protein
MEPFRLGLRYLNVGTDTLQQLILMLQQATKNEAATTFIMVLFMLTSLGAYFNTVASVSRLIWQFCTLRTKPNDLTYCEQILIHLTAKDRGLPHSQFFTQVCSPSVASITVIYKLRLT